MPSSHEGAEALARPRGRAGPSSGARVAGRAEALGLERRQGRWRRPVTASKGWSGTVISARRPAADEGLLHQIAAGRRDTGSGASMSPIRARNGEVVARPPLPLDRHRRVDRGEEAVAVEPRGDAGKRQHRVVDQPVGGARLGAGDRGIETAASPYKSVQAPRRSRPGCRIARWREAGLERGRRGVCAAATACSAEAKPSRTGPTGVSRIRRRRCAGARARRRAGPRAFSTGANQVRSSASLGTWPSSASAGGASAPRRTASPCRRCRSLPRSGTPWRATGGRSGEHPRLVTKPFSPALKASRWRRSGATPRGAGKAPHQRGRHVLLDRDLALQRVVPGEIDDADRAFADQPGGLVVAQAHPDRQGAARWAARRRCGRAYVDRCAGVMGRRLGIGAWRSGRPARRGRPAPRAAGSGPRIVAPTPGRGRIGPQRGATTNSRSGLPPRSSGDGGREKPRPSIVSTVTSSWFRTCQDERTMPPGAGSPAAATRAP